MLAPPPRAGDVLVVQTLDRLSRRTGEMLDFTTELKERGIGFRVLAFPEIDTTGPFGTALLTILGALAQMERDLLAELIYTPRPDVSDVGLLHAC